MHDPVELEEADSTESFALPPPERKILTQPYDLSVQTLNEQWKDQLLQVPEIQREYVWDNGRASRLIESLLLNIPIPPLYFAETHDARFEVIDGHQRVKSVTRYLNNEFGLSGLQVLSELTRKKFFELPDREQRFLKLRTIRVVTISHDSHHSMKFEVFERLNTGGISLNAQELRNSLHRGTFNNTLKDLAKTTSFRACIGTSKPRKRMVDEELVLRFFALRDLLGDYTPPLKRRLNDYMKEHKNPAEDWLAERRELFLGTMEAMASVLADKSFRLIDHNGQPVRNKAGDPLPRGVNRALFDAQSIAFSWADRPIPVDKRSTVTQCISAALKEADTQDAVSLATSDRRRMLDRVSAMVAALKQAGIPVNVPKAIVEADEGNA